MITDNQYIEPVRELQNIPKDLAEQFQEYCFFHQVVPVIEVTEYECAILFLNSNLQPILVSSGEDLLDCIKKAVS